MTYASHGGTILDYMPCRYGSSKLMFRGPARDPDGNHIAVLGGTESYGKFIETPWPELLEQAVGRSVVNLSQQNAGPDVFLNDRTVLDICQSARVTVIEVMGAQNLSNRFYAVHPRRNDRFLRASNMLKGMYPGVDFTEFHFTRHLLTGLHEAAPDIFPTVAAELKDAWVGRMQRLVEQISGPVILLWLGESRMPRVNEDPTLHGVPPLVDHQMIDVLRPRILGVAEVVAEAEELRHGRGQMVHDDMDSAAAAEMLGPVVHKRTAVKLGEVIRKL